MIPMVNKRDLTWKITESKSVCACVCVCVREREREREREWAVIASSSQSSGALSLINDVCVVVSMIIYITDKVVGMSHVVCVRYVSMHTLTIC